MSTLRVAKRCSEWRCVRRATIDNANCNRYNAIENVVERSVVMKPLDKIIKELPELSTEQLKRVLAFVETVRNEGKEESHAEV